MIMLKTVTALMNLIVGATMIYTSDSLTVMIAGMFPLAAATAMMPDWFSIIVNRCGDETLKGPGTASEALGFALEHIEEDWQKVAFLESWSAGTAGRDAEYLKWLADGEGM